MPTLPAPYTTTRPRLAAALALCAVLAACDLLPKSTDNLKAIQQRLVGQPVGDFFTRAGQPKTRYPKLDGATDYVWESISRPGGAAFATIEDRICRMFLAVDPRGTVTAVEILYDDPGRGSTSRCREIVEAPEPAPRR